MAEADDRQPQTTQATASAIGRATAVIVAVGLLDKVLAVGKEVLMAARFGVDAQVDAFNIAYAFPGIVNLLFNGACVAAFVPLYASWLGSQGPARTRDNALTITYASALFFIALAALCSSLSPYILALIGYGFPPDTLAAATAMERALAWLVAIEGVGVICSALLQNWKRFGQLTLAQTLINIGIILFLVFGKDLGINALIYGFLAGTALKVAAMLAAMRGGGLAPFSRFTFRADALRSFALLAAPLLGSALIANSNILIDQSMATSLPAGSVAILRYAYRVNDLPLQIIVMAVSRAIFPFISEQAALGDTQGLRHVFRLSLVFIAMVCLPIICYVLLFADDIVTVLLRRGAFDAKASQQTALTLRCYGVGLFFHAYTFINGAFFSALRQAVTLLRLGLVSLALNFGFNWLFLKLLGSAEAIALSTTVSMGIISTIFFLILKGQLGSQASAGLTKSLAAIVAASLAAVLACWPLRTWLLSAGVNVWLTLGGLSLVFGAIYTYIVMVLKSGDMAEVLSLCLPRLKGKGGAARGG